MPNSAFDYAFDDLKARDIALASASAIRILVEVMVENGMDRAIIEKAFRAKAGELIGTQLEENAANLLRMMGGVVQRKSDE